MIPISRLGLVSLALSLALTTSASAEFLGSWTLYHTPNFLWGSSSTPVTGISVRVAFGPLAGFAGGLDLYETSVLTQGDDGLILVADALSDPDFADIATQLTNGATGDNVFVETRLIGFGAAGAGHNESYWSIRPGSTAPANFTNYTLDRIEMVVEQISWTSPGRDMNHNGNWTDYYIDTRLDFYGTAIPEPAAAAMLAAVAVAAPLWRRRAYRRALAAAH